MADGRKTQEAYGRHMFEAGIDWWRAVEDYTRGEDIGTQGPKPPEPHIALRNAQQEWSRMGVDDGEDRGPDSTLQALDRSSPEA